MTELYVTPLTGNLEKYTFKQSSQIYQQTACIGYLRADLGSNGKEFHSTWNEISAFFKSDEFSKEFDEVINGFGRTGKAFGFQNYGVKPDFITMAKGITSGYLPLAATAVKKEIYEAFKGTEEYDYFRHINTFGGTPAACALALKNIEIMEDEGLFERSAQSGAYLLSSLSQELSGHRYVGDIRGRGLLVGIELVKDRETKEPLDASLVNEVIKGCRQKGVLIGRNGATVAGYNNILALAPPLNIAQKDIDLLVKIMSEEINKL